MNRTAAAVSFSRSRARLLLSVCLLALLAAGFVALADRDGPKTAPPDAVTALPPILTPSQLYDHAQAAVVEVIIDDHLNGSGWIADPSGLVFTAAHVVDRDHKRIEVMTSKGERIEATLVAVDAGHDMAMLRLAGRDAPYPALPTAISLPQPGEAIYLFGSPIYRHAIMIRGYVARRDMAFEYLSEQQTYIETMYVAADTPRGTSGGAWLNARGQVVGLQSGMMLDNSAQVGIAFVTPASAIHQLLQSKESATTLSLGVAIEEMWEQPTDFLRKFPAKTEGIVIRTAHDGGPAAKAGLGESDVIVAVDGVPIRYRDQFMRLILATPKGKDVVLRVIHSIAPDRPRSITVTPQRVEKK
ncbi:MAG: trypsin-like peptidase domain-containing protein [Phycisphaeraceae bacterium]